MPTYQYRCTACSDELEAVQKFTDPSLTTCPSCAGDLRKLFGAVGVVFKGSGFYSTDSRKKSSPDSVSSSARTEASSSGTTASTSSKTAPAKADAPA